MPWNLADPADTAFAITTEIGRSVHTQMPELANDFPFARSFVYFERRAAGRIVLRLEDSPHQQVPTIGQFEGEDLTMTDVLLENRIQPQEAGDHWYRNDVFTYAGPLDGDRVSWLPLTQAVNVWLNRQVVVHVLEMNRTRILRGLDEAPTFNVASLADSLFIIESSSSGRQGTGFALGELGLVTCAHVVHDSDGAELTDAVAFKPDAPSASFAVTVRRANRALDLAVIAAPGLSVRALPVATDVEVHQLDHVAVLGFPNYSFGDTVSIKPAVITGFRMRSGIRRVMLNAGIVAGMSGGPALDRESRVLGVAVTGADSDTRVDDTENHSFIPIDAVNLI